MIDRVHGHPANVGANAHPARPAGLSQGSVFVVYVSNLSDGCPARNWNHPHFGRRQSQNSVASFFGDQLSAATCGPSQLCPFARFQLHIVNHCTQRDIGKTQAITRFYVSIAGSQHHVPHRKPNRSKDISFFAIPVVEEGNIGRPIRIVFNAGNFGRNILFVSLEVDDSITTLVSTTALPCCHSTTGVASSGLLQGLD
jgi:hypothetical protein